MIEFIQKSHTYLNDGVIIPSVSNLVVLATGDDYTSIPSFVLRNAQDFGTDIHEAIDRLLNTGEITAFSDIKRELTFKGFLDIKDQIITGTFLNESIIDYTGRYAGTFDLYCDEILYDYKTNYKLNIPHLEWQLGFYKLALESKGYTVKKCMCIWLRKGISEAKIIEITPRSKEECLEVLKAYEQKNKSIIDNLGY